jgi:hypothetical protein
VLRMGFGVEGVCERLFLGPKGWMGGVSLVIMGLWVWCV